MRPRQALALHLTSWVIVTAGCTSSAAEEQRWFAREIERDLEVEIEPALVRVDSIPSTSIDGMLFLRGVLFDRAQIDAEYYAVNAAVLGGNRQVLRTVSALGEFLHEAGRLPSAMPAQLCREAVAFAGPRSNSRPVPQVYDDQTPIRRFVEALGGFMAPALDTLSFHGLEMRSTAPGESVVRMWVVEPDQLTEYACKVTSDGIQLVELQSLIGGGFRVSP